MSDTAEQANSKPDQGLRLGILEARVDALSSADNKRKTRGLKDPATLVALAAFLISIVTTVTSGYRTYIQDLDTKKAQLRLLLVDLGSQALQRVELTAKYKNDPSLPTITAELYSNNIITAKQAYLLVKELGTNASSVDFGLVSHALGNIGESALADELGAKSLEMATNATEYVGAARNIGRSRLKHRQVAEAEVYLKKALQVYDIYPKDAINEGYVAATYAATQLYWAGDSIDCSMALGHVTEANKYLETFGPNAPADLTSWRDGIVSYCSKPQAEQPRMPAAASPQAEQPHPRPAASSPKPSIK